MPQRFNFNEPILKSVVGGKSALDLPRLNIHTIEEATAFIKGYGYNIEEENDLKKLWYFHRRALVFLDEKLGFAPTEIPDELKEPKLLGDLRKMLIWASSLQNGEQEIELQRWSCAILRVMHVFVHSENDLFVSFSEEIQKQVLTDFQQCIFHDGTTSTTYLRVPSEDSIAASAAEKKTEPLALMGFEVKPFKTSSSTVVKLLAKPDALAMSVYDKLGLRFITNSMFDTYRVVRFLIEENLVSFPHIMPDQSSNNIYPVDLFMEVVGDLKQKSSHHLTNEEIEHEFKKKLEHRKDSVEYLRKENNFSGSEYRFIKFICRKLIRVELPDAKGQFSFFYPYEVQIMDKDSHQKILSGPAQHQAYKERQRIAARKRVFPSLQEKNKAED